MPVFTATIIAALIAAGVATAKAIGKGVQAKKQRESREEQQQKHLSAMEKAAIETERYREDYKQQQLVGMQHQQEQMQPLFDIMSRAGASAGYQAPDMSWLMQPQAQARPNVGPEVRKVKNKKTSEATPAPYVASGPQGGSWRTDPTGGGSTSSAKGPANWRTEPGGQGPPSTTGGPR